MKVLFRVDASVHIGSGHVMRCLTLAHALTKQNLESEKPLEAVECHFICQQEEGHLNDYIRQQGFTILPLLGVITDELADAEETLKQLNQSYELLVVDHYALAKPYCTALRQRCQYIMVIDDLANRAHDCDILLDQNMLPQPELRYAELVPKHCIQLLGPYYALLRQEFYQILEPRLAHHVLISFGGSDEQNLTSLAITALQQLKQTHITADIVIGKNNPWQVGIKQQVAQLANLQLHIQCDYMAKLMSRASIMLGAGGSSHWERCITKLPSLIVTVADNQQATTAYLAQLGACIWLGQAVDMSAELFAQQLSNYLRQPARLNEISQAAASIVPALAGTAEVVKVINMLYLPQA